MRISKTWVAVGAVATLGLTGGATAVAAVNDRGDLPERRAGITLDSVSDTAPTGAVDASPESADSPNASAVDSVDSPFDSPGDPRFLDASPESADSPNASAVDSPVRVAPAKPVAADSADSPVRRTATRAVASADSPVRATAPRAVQSANSPASAVSAASAASAASPASADSAD